MSVSCFRIERTSLLSVIFSEGLRSLLSIAFIVFNLVISRVAVVLSANVLLVVFAAFAAILFTGSNANVSMHMVIKTVSFFIFRGVWL